jgi:carbamoyl-phosphate synthase large subunit
MQPQRRLRILLSSAGRRVELINCFRGDAERLGVSLEVFATDRAPELSAACHAADRSFAVPPVAAPDFVHRMLSICREHDIDLVVPTVDPELEILSQAAPRFAEAGTRVAISAPEVVSLVRDKLRCGRFLAEHGLPEPATRDAAPFCGEPPHPFRPMILKPRRGSSSRGIRRIEHPEQWPRDGAPADCIAQDLLRGDEYSVYLFFDVSGRLRAAVPHQRIEVRDGEVTKALSRREPVLLDLAKAVGALLSQASGALIFQAFVQASGEASIIELNARFGGGFPLTHRTGARFSQWLLEEVLGWPSSANNDWRANVLMLRYDAAVFVDV